VSSSNHPYTPDTLSASVMRTLFALPRPGQSGALQFDGTNVTEFLEDWELVCEDYGLTPEQMCTRLPGYCTSSVKEVVKLLPGQTASNWETLKKKKN
jgi:hypothetical protein